MEVQETVLVPGTLKATSGNTRIKILKELSYKPMMPTTISQRLNKSIPTILEHLEKLTKSGLVEKREEEGKKFVFYALTRTGMELVSNKSRISIMFYASISLFIAGILLFGAGSYSNATYKQSIATTSAEAAAPATGPLPYSAPLLNVLPIMILVGAFVLLLLYIRKLRQFNVIIGS